MKEKEIKVIHMNDEKGFETAVNAMLSMDGWKISSTHCSYNTDPKYDCLVFIAILMRE